jgi:ABC-type phosphate/phosphonate transport system permease subunit
MLPVVGQLCSTCAARANTLAHALLEANLGCICMAFAGTTLAWSCTSTIAMVARKHLQEALAVLRRGRVERTWARSAWHSLGCASFGFVGSSCVSGLTV